MKRMLILAMAVMMATTAYAGTLLYSGALCDTTYTLDAADFGTLGVTYTDCTIQCSGTDSFGYVLNAPVDAGDAVFPVIGTNNFSMELAVTANTGSWYTNYANLQLILFSPSNDISSWLEFRLYDTYVQTINWGGAYTYPDLAYYETTLVDTPPTRIKLEVAGTTYTAYYHDGADWVLFSTIDFTALRIDGLEDPGTTIDATGYYFKPLYRQTGVGWEVDELLLTSDAITGNLNDQANACGLAEPEMPAAGTLALGLLAGGTALAGAFIVTRMRRARARA